MNGPELAARLAAIEARLGRIESEVGIAAPAHRQATVAAADAGDSSSLHLVEQHRVASAEQTTADAPPWMPQHQTEVVNITAKQSGLEQTIGLKWAGWVGAVVLVIGAGLGIKFAYDQGWFLAMPPVTRLILMCMAGLGLIAVGEWIYRRINALSAACFFGAGVAVLFLVSYSGHAYYNLYGRNTALLFMTVSTLIGAAVSRRGNMVSVAVLAILGGNLAPAILHESHPQVFGFLTYLLMLQLTALMLAGWGGTRKWWTLRGLSLLTTTFWVAMLSAKAATDASGMIVLFVVGFAMLYQAELLFSTEKAGRQFRLPGPVFSLVVTAAVTIAVLYLFRESTAFVRVIWIIALACITGFTSMGCSRRGSPVSAMQILSTGYLIQSAALVAVIIPVSLSGIWIVAGWGLLAVAFTLVGLLTSVPVALFSGPVIWFLALLALGFWSAWDSPEFGHQSLIWLKIAGTNIPAYACMAWMLAIGGHLVAWLMGRSRQWAATTAGRILTGFSALLWLTVSICALPPTGATGWLLIYLWTLAIADVFTRELAFLFTLLAVLMLTTTKWVFEDTLAPLLSVGSAGAQPLSPLAPSMGLLIAGSLVGLYWLRRDRIRGLVSPLNPSAHARMIEGIWVGVTVILWWAGSFEIDQVLSHLRSGRSLVNPGFAEHLWISIFWSVFAIVSVAAGFLRRLAGLRYFGLALFAVALFKVVVIDLSELSSGYRILSFLGLGLLLMGTSVLYGKLSPKTLGGTNESGGTL